MRGKFRTIIADEGAPPTIEFFRLDNMRNAFVLSLELALLSGTIAAVLGTMGALFLARRRGVMAGLLHSLFLAPLVFPTIILGLALLLLYKSVGLPVFPGLVLAHCVIGMPYCFRTVLASVQALDPSLEEAGQSLGAGPISTLFLVTLPLIWQGVVSGWPFALCRLVRRIEHGPVLERTGIDAAADRDLQLPAVSGSQLVIAAASTLNTLCAPAKYLGRSVTRWMSAGLRFQAKRFFYRTLTTTFPFARPFST